MFSTFTIFGVKRNICGHLIVMKFIITESFGRAPSEDSDQPAHSRSLIRIFAVRGENIAQIDA